MAPDRFIALATLSLLLSACGGGSTRPTVSAPPPPRQPIANPPPTRPLPPPAPVLPQVQVQQAPGLEGVIGSRSQALFEQFGTPRLDVHEGDVRKLQFSGSACVLDIYLYPPEGGGEPVATHVDARRASDGLDVDRAACIAALRRR
jgi:hypothetical protein